MPFAALPMVSAAARAHGRRHPVTLMVWHDIVPAEKLVWFDTTTREFDTQLARIARVGGRPISLPALYRYLATGAPIPPPGAVVLCFDDNTQGIFDYAFPRLRKCGWPFVVSAHTKYVGVTTGKVHCTWDELRTMAKGGAQIVSQTHTHPPDLRTLSSLAHPRSSLPILPENGIAASRLLPPRQAIVWDSLRITALLKPHHICWESIATPRTSDSTRPLRLLNARSKAKNTFSSRTAMLVLSG